MRRDQAAGLGAGEPGPRAGGEEFDDLLGVEAQVFEAQLDDLIVELQAGRGDRRLVAREQHEVHVRRRVGKQVVEGAVELGGCDRLVVVVDDDVQVAVDLVAQLRDEQGRHFGRRHGHFVGFGEAFEQDGAESGDRLADGLHERGDEHGRVVVEDVEPVPRGAPAEPARGFGDDHSFAVAGRRTHDEEPPLGALGKLGEHGGAYKREPAAGRGDLGRDECRDAGDAAARWRALVIPHWQLPDPGAPRSRYERAHYIIRRVAAEGSLATRG